MYLGVISQVPSILFLEISWDLELTRLDGWPVSCGNNMPAHLSSVGLQVCTITHDFLCGYRGLNSGLQPCVTNSLLINLSH